MLFYEGNALSTCIFISAQESATMPPLSGTLSGTNAGSDETALIHDQHEVTPGKLITHWLNITVYIQ